MTISEMQEIREKRGYSYKQLSEYCGVPAVTLQKILSGKTANPRKATLDAIERVLSSDEQLYQGRAYAYADESRTSIEDSISACEQGDGAGNIYYRSDEGCKKLEETAPQFGNGIPYKKNGEYTLEDYYALPDDIRVELIDGEFFVMNAPYTVHQDITSYIHMEIYNHIRNNKGKCKVYESPVDIQLDMDDKTMVEPDVVVICDRDKIKRKVVYGAPDFILEVLSKSTKKKDMFLKLYKYSNAGVREYWMIDPDKRLLIKYDLTDGENLLPKINPLKGEEPVLIFDGKLKINLDEINDLIDEYETIPDDE